MNGSLNAAATSGRVGEALASWPVSHSGFGAAFALAPDGLAAMAEAGQDRWRAPLAKPVLH